MREREQGRSTQCCTSAGKVSVDLSQLYETDKNDSRKTNQLRTDGQASLKASISSLWGPKQLDSLSELAVDLCVVPEKTALRRPGVTDPVE